MARAKLKSAGVSGYKARRVADLVRGLSVLQAEDYLSQITSPIAKTLLRVIASASANAINNDGLNRDNLLVKTIIINQGPKTKRFRARSRGMTGAFNHPSSHITVEVSDRV